MKNIKLPCGINKTREVVYIDDAKNGIECECICPACKSPLVAKNGGQKRETERRARCPSNRGHTNLS